MERGSLNIKRSLKLLLVNGLTFSRVLCAIYLAYAAHQTGMISQRMFEVGLFGGLTDLFDGMLANLLKAKTKFGAIFDKAADKIFICVIVATLYYSSPLPSDLLASLTGFLMALLIVKELLIALFGIVFAFLRKIRLEANWWGKAKMWAECAAVLFWTLSLLKDPTGAVFMERIAIINFLLLVAVCLAGASGYSYLKDFLRSK